MSAKLPNTILTLFKDVIYRRQRVHYRWIALNSADQKVKLSNQGHGYFAKIALPEILKILQRGIEQHRPRAPYPISELNEYLTPSFSLLRSQETDTTAGDDGNSDPITESVGNDAAVLIENKRTADTKAALLALTWLLTEFDEIKAPILNLVEDYIQQKVTLPVLGLITNVAYHLEEQVIGFYDLIESHRVPTARIEGCSRSGVPGNLLVIWRAYQQLFADVNGKHNKENVEIIHSAADVLDMPAVQVYLHPWLSEEYKQWVTALGDAAPFTAYGGPVTLSSGETVHYTTEFPDRLRYLYSWKHLVAPYILREVRQLAEVPRHELPIGIAFGDRLTRSLVKSLQDRTVTDWEPFGLNLQLDIMKSLGADINRPINTVGEIAECLLPSFSTYRRRTPAGEQIREFLAAQQMAHLFEENYQAVISAILNSAPLPETPKLPLRNQPIFAGVFCAHLLLKARQGTAILEGRSPMIACGIHLYKWIRLARFLEHSWTDADYSIKVHGTKLFHGDEDLSSTTAVISNLSAHLRSQDRGDFLRPSALLNLLWDHTTKGTQESFNRLQNYVIDSMNEETAGLSKITHLAPNELTIALRRMMCNGSLEFDLHVNFLSLHDICTTIVARLSTLYGPDATDTVWVGPDTYRNVLPCLRLMEKDVDARESICGPLASMFEAAIKLSGSTILAQAEKISGMSCPVLLDRL